MRPRPRLVSCGPNTTLFEAVNALEKGKFDPSLPLAFKASRLFGMPIEEIFQYEN